MREDCSCIKTNKQTNKQTKPKQTIILPFMAEKILFSPCALLKLKCSTKAQHQVLVCLLVVTDLLTF